MIRNEMTPTTVGPRPGESGADESWLREAVELSRRCPPSDTAFSVGALLVAADGRLVSFGYSREHDPRDHAEEVALAKAAGRGSLAHATLYTSLEPCLRRASRPKPCAELIAAAGIARVVLAWREPPLFTQGGGARSLREHGVEVIELEQLAAAARLVNAHLVGGR